MTQENGKSPKIAKYREILGISESTDLPALKERYANMHEKIQTQIHSKDSNTSQKGHKNMQVLEQAFSELAGDIRSRERESQTDQNMVIEHTSMRVGFQVLEGGSKFAVMRTSRVAGFGSGQTNNILSSSWPGGKMSIYNDRLDLDCLLGSFQVKFHDIAAIEKAWYIPFWLRIKQHKKNTESVHIFGWGLGKKLKEVVKRNRLPLKLDY